MEGYLMDINPLDQPGVEAYKNFMFGILGRADVILQVETELSANGEPARSESPWPIRSSVRSSRCRMRRTSSG